jgi:L-iditol 2-dehydrogenase
LLRVTAVGVCGSDLHWFSEGAIGDARVEHPLVLGHEFTALTESGRRVAVDPAIACQQCEFCLEGHPNLCLNLHFAGHGKDDGALRETMAWPERCLYTLPDSLTDEDGVLLEPLGIAIHAVDLAHLRTGMRVAVLGCGPIGLLLLQVARAAGASQLIATDPLPHRLEAARALGATHVFQAAAGQENPSVLAASGGLGVHVTFEAAGENAAVESAVAVTRNGGKVILVGIPGDDRTSFTASIARRKGLTFKVCRRMKHTYPRAIQLVERGLVDLRPLVTHRFPLLEATQAFAVAQRREGLKVIIEV